MTRGFPVLLVFVLAAGLAALACETNGFRVMTSAGARQLSLQHAPQRLPDVRLVDQDGAPFSLGAYRGRTVLVDFIYTRCPTVCSERGDDFANALRLIKATASGAPVDLLSISFDLRHDDREALRLYGERFGATAPHWRIAAPADAQQLAELLRSFGVVVIPDGMGGFVHNAAVYVIDARGRLAGILDAAAPPQLVAAALRGAAP
jgi:protein SCO1/2